ncbi:MAG TPA: PhzF family phenazine biosynthesis protein [Thermomicrobiales bacterium]|nr:PhzF family phenazine biosynthesis protein [Thermomicrobiales bacterium]
MERWSFRIVDVFSERPLAGNQLAVFENATRIPEAQLQPLAQEIGYSETVFAYPKRNDAHQQIRIFTPTSEIPFAGHPVLGTAVVIATNTGANRVVLETGRGLVPVRIDRTVGPAARGTMEQPIPSFKIYDKEVEFLRALGVDRSVLPVTIYDNGLAHVYAMLERPDDVAAVRPDFSALSELARSSGLPLMGFNVFSGSGPAWKTRMFAPADDIAEDPATGSAAGPLALHLARHGRIPWDTEIRIAQGAEIGRPSELFARVSGNADHVTRIEVSGHAVPVGGGWFDGELLRAIGTA